MAFSIADAVRQLVHNKGISEELIMNIVKEALLAAYKKKFNTTKNAVTIQDEETGDIAIYSKKEVVDEVEDSITEISIEDAKKKNVECEMGDEVLVEVHPHELGRIAAQAAKNIVIQKIREIEKDIIYSEFSQKIGQLVVGTYQREKSRSIYVDLGKCEAILPRSEQSPREAYGTGDRIKALVLEVNNDPAKGSPVVLSRAHPLFVQRIFEQEVPEISDKTVDIISVARKAGYRTKISVDSKTVDPVGACVGLKGIRIQNIIRELEGEKIDIVRFSDDVREYIANSLTPATIDRVVVIDDKNKKAVVVVDDDQLSLAIGKDGWNVRLGSKLVNWEIDVKSMADFQAEGYVDIALKDASKILGDMETHDIALLELSDVITDKLRAIHIDSIEKLVDQAEGNLQELAGLTDEEYGIIVSTLESMVEVVDDGDEDIKRSRDDYQKEAEISINDVFSPLDDDSDEEDGESEDESSYKVDGEEEDSEVYEGVFDEDLLCPVCEHPIKETMRVCPNCGVELEFEFE